MTDKIIPFQPLSLLPAFDPDTGDVTVVIETPRGSPNKYDYDEIYHAFRLGGVLPAGMYFPYDFGFVPSTTGEDGDGIDVLVLLDTPVGTGCILTARPIGAIEANQRQRSGKWIRNDRILAVATHAYAHQHIKTLDDLRPHMLDEIQAFFVEYNLLRGKKFKPLARVGPAKAHKLIEQGKAAFAKQKKKAPKGRV